MDKDCKVKTASEIRKASELLKEVSDDDVIGLWDSYWMIESEGFSDGPCYCAFVSDLHYYTSPEKAAEKGIKDFVNWATMSPLQIRQSYNVEENK